MKNPRLVLRSKAIPLSTELGGGTRFNGVISFRDSLRINGQYDGKILSKGVLFVGEEAEVHADIKVGSLIVAGTIRGDIVAVEKVELLSSANVVGDIRTAKLTIADGVFFRGNCQMIDSPENVDIFSKSSSALKRALRERGVSPSDGVSSSDSKKERVISKGVTRDQL